MAASRVRSRAAVCQQSFERTIIVGAPVSSSPLMREIDSIASDCGLSQRVGRVVSRDLVAGKKLGHRHQTWGGSRDAAVKR